MTVLIIIALVLTVLAFLIWLPISIQFSRNRLFVNLPEYSKQGFVSRDSTKTINERHLAKICPIVAEKVRKLIELAHDAGFQLQIVQSLRTWSEQDALYAQGRTKSGKRVTNARGGQSWHNFGLAIDFCFIVDGEVSWLDKLFAPIGTWAKSAGLDWGGNWKRIVDKPHVELTLGLTLSAAANLWYEGGLKAVWAEIARRSAKQTVTSVLDNPQPLPPVVVAHIVEPDENLGEIAAKYHTTTAAIVRLNSLKNPDVLAIGQKLLIPQI